MKLFPNDLLALRKALPRGAIKMIAQKLNVARHVVSQNLTPKISGEYRQDVINEAQIFIKLYGKESSSEDE